MSNLVITVSTDTEGNERVWNITIEEPIEIVLYVLMRDAVVAIERFVHERVVIPRHEEKREGAGIRSATDADRA